jgi:hypothetical protein
MTHLDPVPQRKETSMIETTGPADKGSRDDSLVGLPDRYVEAGGSFDDVESELPARWDNAH